MSEQGGPTTQSGVLYQNSVGALYLGKMLSPTKRLNRETVLRVRAETLDQVDDIVVEFQDGHRLFIQAKETIREGEIWKELWLKFKQQFDRKDFCEGDQLCLATSVSTELISDMQGLITRRSGEKSSSGWRARLTKSQLDRLTTICRYFDPAMTEDEAFLFFANVDVQVTGTIECIEKDSVPLFMPESSTTAHNLFAALRDLLGGKSRNRGDFNSAELIDRLADMQIEVVDHKNNVRQYREGVLEVCSLIGIPGTDISGPVEEMFVWPMITRSASYNSGAIVNADEFDVADPQGAMGFRETFPEHISRAVIVAGAGFGKSSLLRVIARELASSHKWLPVLVSLPDFSISGKNLLDYIICKTRDLYQVEVEWDYYIKHGRAVLLFDGLDEVSEYRQETLEKINALSGTHRNVPWLLVVRDRTALSVGVNATMLTIRPFDFGRKMMMANCYVKHGGTLSGSIRSQLSWNPLLSRLTSVPLFLGLLMATEAERVPTRVLVIESYLYRAFQQRKRNGKTFPASPRSVLFQAAEILGYQTLLHPKGLTIRSAMTSIGSIPSIVPDTVLEDLELCGVIRENAGRFSFLLPTVQEFFAGLALSRQGTDALIAQVQESRFRNWAQTVQFAIEHLEDGSEVVSKVLDMQDDAFSSLTRMVALCVLNGARVSDDVRTRLRQRLVELWRSLSTHWLRHEVANILVYGFQADLAALEPWINEPLDLLKSAAFAFGQAADPSIATALLKRVLDRPLDPADEDVVNLALDLSTAFNHKAHEVAKILVDRSKSSNPEELEVLLCFLGVLRPESLTADISRYVKDCDVPPAIRLCIARKLTDFQPSDHVALANLVLAAPLTQDDMVPGFDFALETLKEAKDHEGLLLALKTARTARLRGAILNHLSLPGKQHIRALISAMVEDGTVGALEGAVLRLQFEAGADEDIRTLSESLHTVSHRNVVSSAKGIVPATTSTETLSCLLVALETLPWPVRCNFAESLSTSVSPHLVQKAPATLGVCRELFYAWASKCSGPYRVDLLASSLRLGHTACLDEFALELEGALSWPEDVGIVLGELDGAVYSMHRWIQDLNENGRGFLPHYWAGLVERYGFQALPAISLVSKSRSTEALQTLLQLRRSPKVIDMYVLEAIEEELMSLSAELQILLDRNADGSLTVRL